MKSLRPKPGTEPSEIWQANQAKAKEAVRPIDILTESSNRALVLLYRFEGSQEPLGGLAQLEERVLCKHEVIGSSPIFSTSNGW